MRDELPDEARRSAGSRHWDELVSCAKILVDNGALQSNEIDYKLEIAQKLSEARNAVLNGFGNWTSLVKAALPNRQGSPISWRVAGNLKRWLEASPDDALEALRALWASGVDDETVIERVKRFCDALPAASISGTGTQANVASVLLMGLNVENLPPFRYRAFNKAYRRAGYSQPEGGPAAHYERALGFLDELIQEASKRGLELRHRLDAQSVVWMSQDDNFWSLADNFESPSPEQASLWIEPDLDELADELFLTQPPGFLHEIETLLADKKQVIFQGPPGTGKTYVAQQLANHLAGSKDRVTLVQFHPSYAYEDFVRGFRPALVNGQPGFELKDGPLLRAAERARDDSNRKHFIIIDEINRGNLAKVFGELYYLLEYRDEKITLQYQAEEGEKFSLPGNLYIIGTMNTADRSIALVDLALRRRFYFVEFHPDSEPIRGVLRRWLEANHPAMEWVADVVEEANKLLSNDRHAAIGPSYFMKGSLDVDIVNRIWKHSVLPYIEERLFGESDRLGDFALDELRGVAQTDGGSPNDDDGAGNEGGGAVDA